MKYLIHAEESGYIGVFDEVHFNRNDGDFDDMQFTFSHGELRAPFLKKDKIKSMDFVLELYDDLGHRMISIFSQLLQNYPSSFRLSSVYIFQ